MTRDVAMAELERLGTERNRRVYARHGAGENQYGVSFADLRALAKRIGTDQELAEELWATGNADARALATMICDPAAFTSRQLDGWLRGLDYYLLVDLLSDVAARTRFSRGKATLWTAAREDSVGQAGWNVVARLALADGELPDEYFEDELRRIEVGIHAAPNRTRHAMNGALIAVGGRNPALRKRALAVAKRIGRVAVDHGETGCKTPAAGRYIEKMWARRKAKTAA